MSNLTFAKLVATPTDTSWSQVYNAGNLFATLSLSINGEDETISLQSVGKDFFNNIEAEFFTLEDKTLTTIKKALSTSIKTLPENVLANLCLAYFSATGHTNSGGKDALYLFIYGGGRIIMKRNNGLGTLLEKSVRQAQDKLDSSEIVTSSGFLNPNDTIILQTPQFAEDMSTESIASSLDLTTPEDIAESLSPTMHEKDDGGQAAIIINFQEADTNTPIDEEQDEPFEPTPSVEPETVIPLQTATLAVATEETIPHENSKKISFPKLKLPLFWKKQSFLGLNHRKKLFLSIALIILVLLFISVALTKKQQADKKTAELFESIYTPALKDYQDGIDIKSINKSFAFEDFQKAEKLLKDGKNKFKKGSKEEKQIAELLTKIESELGDPTTVNLINPKEVDASKSNFLSTVKDNSEAKSFAKSEDSVYFITEKSVVSIDKNAVKKDVIKNDDDWTKPVGLSLYQGNIYILDQEKGVLKFTSGSDGFGKSSYFKDSPDMSNSTALAIDGSVWILLKDGNILKYTKGVSDGFKVSVLDKALKNPIKIATDLDTDNLYILDAGNSRIVKLNKKGDFENQYKADILKSTKEFEVSEKDSKIFILSGGKIWEIPL